MEAETFQGVLVSWALKGKQEAALLSQGSPGCGPRGGKGPGRCRDGESSEGQEQGTKRTPGEAGGCALGGPCGCEPPLHSDLYE